MKKVKTCLYRINTGLEQLVTVWKVWISFGVFSVLEILSRNCPEITLIKFYYIYNLSFRRFLKTTPVIIFVSADVFSVWDNSKGSDIFSKTFNKLVTIASLFAVLFFLKDVSSWSWTIFNKFALIVDKVNCGL